MKNSAGRVIRDMSNWDYVVQNSFECRYETLMMDSDMNVVRDIIRHLGFEEGETDSCLRQFWKYSLFGKLREDAKVAKSKHIRSGEVTQWKTAFDKDLGRAFLEDFGNVLIELGYERDNSWVDTLPSNIMR
jgi:hypothetical protein